VDAVFPGFTSTHRAVVQSGPFSLRSITLDQYKEACTALAADDIGKLYELNIRQRSIWVFKKAAPEEVI